MADAFVVSTMEHDDRGVIETAQDTLPFESPTAAETDMNIEGEEAHAAQEDEADDAVIGMNGVGGVMANHSNIDASVAAAATALLDDAFGDSMGSFGDFACSTTAAESTSVIDDPFFGLDPVNGAGNNSHDHDMANVDVDGEFGQAKQTGTAVSPSTEPAAATNEILLQDQDTTAEEGTVSVPDQQQQQQNQQEDEKEDESNAYGDFAAAATSTTSSCEIPTTSTTSNDPEPSVLLDTGDHSTIEIAPPSNDNPDHDDDKELNHNMESNGKARISDNDVHGLLEHDQSPSTVVVSSAQNGQSAPHGQAAASNGHGDFEDSFGDFGSAAVVDVVVDDAPATTPGVSDDNNGPASVADVETSSSPPNGGHQHDSFGDLGSAAVVEVGFDAVAASATLAVHDNIGPASVAEVETSSPPNDGHPNDPDGVADDFGDFGNGGSNEPVSLLEDDAVPEAAETEPHGDDDNDETDDFGDFGSAEVTVSTPAPQLTIDDSIIEPGGASTTADVSAVTATNENNDDDDDDDFGNFGSAEHTAPPPQPLDTDTTTDALPATVTPDAGDDDDDDDFGNFGSAEHPAPPPPPLESDTATGAMPATVTPDDGDGDDEDFGNFGSAEVSAPAPQGDAAPDESAGAEAGVEGQVEKTGDDDDDDNDDDDDDDDDDFGDFGSAAEFTATAPTPSPPMATVDNTVDDDDDDFGDFGSAEFTSDQPNAEPQPTGAATAAVTGGGGDDDFGDFSDFNQADSASSDPTQSVAQAAPSIATPVERIVPGSQRAKSFFLGVFDRYNVDVDEMDDDDPDTEAETSLNGQDETIGDTQAAVKAMVDSLDQGTAATGVSEAALLEVLGDTKMLSKRKEPRTIVSDQQLDGSSSDNMFFFFESLSTARASLTASRQNKNSAPQQPRPASRQMYLPDVLDVRLPTAADLRNNSSSPSPPTRTTANTTAVATATKVAVPPITSTVARIPPQETRATLPPLPATTDAKMNHQKAPSTNGASNDVKRFLQQIPNLSYMLSSKLSLPNGNQRDNSR